MATNALDMFIDATAVGMAAVQVTGKEKDVFTAGGYGAFVKSVTGRMPKVVDRDGQAVLVLDKEQVEIMQKWVRALMAKPKEQPSVKIELGPVIKPIAMQYALLIALGGMALGYAAAKFIR